MFKFKIKIIKSFFIFLQLIIFCFYVDSSSLCAKTKRINKTNNDDFLELIEKPWFYHNDEIYTWHNKFSGKLSLSKPKYNLYTDFSEHGNFKPKNSVGFGWHFRSGGRTSSYIGYLQLTHSSDIKAFGKLNYDIEFDGQKFKMNNNEANVNFRLELDVIDFYNLRKFRNTKIGLINFLYGFRTLQSNLIVKDINSPVSVSYFKTLPLLNLGFDIHTKITNRLYLSSIISGFMLSIGERNGKFNNNCFTIKYDFNNIKRLGINVIAAAGYKKQGIEVNIFENQYVVEHSGPFLKLIAKF